MPKKIGYKIKPRFKKGELKGDLIGRAKKVFAPTKQEKKTLKRFHKKFKKKIPSRKRIKSLGTKINFRNFF